MKKEKLKELYYNKGYAAAVKEDDIRNEMARLREMMFRYAEPAELMCRIEQMEKRIDEICKKLEEM